MRVESPGESVNIGRQVTTHTFDFILLDPCLMLRETKLFDRFRHILCVERVAMINDVMSACTV